MKLTKRNKPKQFHRSTRFDGTFLQTRWYCYGNMLRNGLVEVGGSNMNIKDIDQLIKWLIRARRWLKHSKTKRKPRIGGVG